MPHRTTHEVAVDVVGQCSGVSRVLFVEDDEQVRPAIARGLREAGFEVVALSCTAEALRWLEHREADLLLLDFILGDGDGDGTELLAVWKARHPGRPVIVVSGATSEADQARAFQAGAEDFMRKPVSVTELLQRIAVQDRVLRATSALQQTLRQADLMRIYSTEAAALLAHDLNGGLTVAAAELDFLHRGGPLDSHERQEGLDSARHAIARMIGLVRNFVDIVRSEDGVMRANRMSVDARTIMREVAKLHRTSACTIELDAPARLDAEIDPILFERVLHNLTVNAVRYTPAGGRVRLAGRRAEVPAPTLVVEVSNTGPAIPPAVASGLFRKYQTGDDRRAQSGMGLYFCRLACEAHGGSIALADREGFAVTFEVRLPLAPR